MQFVPGVMRLLANVSPLFILFVFTKIGVDSTTIGNINYYIALVTILGIFTDFGLPELIQKTVPQTSDKAKALSNLLIMELIVAASIALIFLVADRFIGIGYGNSSLLFLVIIASSCNTFTLAFNALGAKFRVAFYFGLSALLFVATSIVLYLLGQEANSAFLVGRALSWLIVIAIVIIDLYLNKLIVFRIGSFDYKYTVNIVLGNTGNALIGQWDGIITSLVRGFQVNGIYKSASLIGSLPQGISTILSTKFLPEYSSLIGQGKLEQVKTSVKKVALAVGSLGVVAAFSLVFLGKPLLTLVFNLEIAENAYVYLPIIVLASSLWAAVSPAISALQAAGKASTYRNILAIQVACYLLLSSLLVSYNFLFLPITLLGSTVLASLWLLKAVGRLKAGEIGGSDRP